MLAKAANLIQFLKVEDEGEDRFAFRDFIAKLDECEGAKPWIFVPRKEDYFEASKPLMACWLECAASAVLGLSPSPGRGIPELTRRHSCLSLCRRPAGALIASAGPPSASRRCKGADVLWIAGRSLAGTPKALPSRSRNRK